MELNAIDPVSVPKPLPKNIVLLSQAYHAKAYNAWQQKYCNGLNYPETDITEYTYKFAKALYLPLHALPIMSHASFAKPFAEKNNMSIFQVQSLKYVDEYRKKKLHNALKIVNGICTLHGRFNSSERGIVIANYPEFSDYLLKHCIDNSNKLSESFLDSAKVLADHKLSLIITDERYARFGLCPNRFVEALSVGTLPVLVPGVLDNCDATLQQIGEDIIGSFSDIKVGKDLSTVFIKLSKSDKSYVPIDSEFAIDLGKRPSYHFRRFSQSIWRWQKRSRYPSGALFR
jgi:hypothetical protein